MAKCVLLSLGVLDPLEFSDLLKGSQLVLGSLLDLVVELLALLPEKLDREVDVHASDDWVHLVLAAYYLVRGRLVGRCVYQLAWDCDLVLLDRVNSIQQAFIAEWGQHRGHQVGRPVKQKQRYLPVAFPLLKLLLRVLLLYHL